MNKNSGLKKIKSQTKPGKDGALKKPHINKEITDLIYTVETKKENNSNNISIAFISGRLGSIFISAVARGVENRIVSLGGTKRSLIYHTPRNSGFKAIQDEIKDIVSNSSANGIIVLSITPDEESIKIAARAKIPIVVIEREIKGINSVKVDNFLGGYMAAEYLIQRGRKKPAIIIDPQVKDNYSSSYERLLGYKAALKKYGIILKKENIMGVDFHTIENGRQAMDNFGIQIKKIDSIFSIAGDMAAIGFMIEAKSEGIKIPQDISVIGFDDMEMDLAISPALTTIRQPIEGMGITAVDILDDVIKRKIKSTKSVIMTPELIIRESV